VTRTKLDILKGRKLSEVLKTLPPERQATIEILAKKKIEELIAHAQAVSQIKPS
jgi:hypothetical protein